MNIACLAWGSLVWDPRDLPIQRRWFDDGPFARVEFTRQFKDGRITIVLDEGAEAVRLLWARMTMTDLEAAAEALSKRERITAKDWKSRIGSWHTGQEEPKVVPCLRKWAEAHGIDAAVWTSLRPQYVEGPEIIKKRPSPEWVLAYLRSLTGPTRDVAERYVRSAPPQIDTEYRRRIEAALGWTHQ